MDMSLFILPDAVFGQTPNAQPVGGMHAEVLQPNPVEENDLPWWHTIDEMIANLPVDDGQKVKLKAYAEAISDPNNAPGHMADVGGIDGDVLRIVTTGTRKIARQKQINASMDKSMTAAQIMRETVRKAGGEGSRGGRITGHTKSGAAIYNNGGHHEAYSRQDHKDAAEHHASAARDSARRVSDHKEDMKAKNGNTDSARRGLATAEDSVDKHQRLAAHHTKMAGK